MSTRRLLPALLLTTMLYAPAAFAEVDKDMQAVLDAHAALKPKPIESLTPAEARKQPTVTDAVKQVMKQKDMNPNDPMGVETKDVSMKTDGRTLQGRLYMPEGTTAKEKLPVVVYYHGGGWVLADVNVYDAGPRAMAKMAKAIVLSAEYRHAPENKFPAAHDDAYAAYQWALSNIAGYGGDPKRVAVMGESAGGNLAINTAIKARDNKVQLPVAEVLVYPVAGVDMSTPSYTKNADAKPLNKPMMAWFMKQVTSSNADVQDPRLDIVGKADLKGLPPTTVITAEYDPLQSEGQLLAEKLKQAGVKVDVKDYSGVTHEFFGMGAVVGQAKAAEKLAASDLKDAFDK